MAALPTHRLLIISAAVVLYLKASLDFIDDDFSDHHLPRSLYISHHVLHSINASDPICAQRMRPCPYNRSDHHDIATLQPHCKESILRCHSFDAIYSMPSHRCHSIDAVPSMPFDRCHPIDDAPSMPFHRCHFIDAICRCHAV